VERFAEEILPGLQGLDTAVIINVCGNHDEEYAEVVEYLNDRDGITAYELNVSCPNVKQEGRCPALYPDATYRIVKLVKRISRRPLITKLTPNAADIIEVALSAQEAGSDALSLVNTFLALAVDAETRRPALANVFGGLSGPAIKPLALRCVYQVAARVSVPVIGMGGIMTGTDAAEFLISGASAVQVGTANFVDPHATLNIISELEEYGRRQGLEKISELTGTLKI
jgi:dihydroorotate dehydrogenase (NAD+) catalytic subunit